MLALLLALASPELDVRGISVSYGNTVVENAFRNAVAILRRAGKRTTLAVGARRPLKRPLAVARDTHGESGLGYAELPPAGVILDFVKSLDRLLAEQPDTVTRSEEHTSELQSRLHLVCRLLLEKKKKTQNACTAPRPPSARTLPILSPPRPNARTL